MSSRIRRLILGLSVVVIVGWLLTGVVTVAETEGVIVERLGQRSAVFDEAEDRGLHLRWPWPIERTRRFDTRIQVSDPLGRETFTRDRKNIVVDIYYTWRIAEPGDEPADEPPIVLFDRNFDSFDQARDRLDSRVRSLVATRVGELSLSDLLPASDIAIPTEDSASRSTGQLEDLSERLRAEMNQGGAGGSLREESGIEILTVRIKHLGLPVGNHQAVFERMRSERQKIADRYRSAGEAHEQRITSLADRQAEGLLARADAEAARIRSDAEAEALAIIADAAGTDREFATFLRTLEAYRTILGPNATLIFSSQSPPFRSLTDGPPSGRPDTAESSEQP